MKYYNIILGIVLFFFLFFGEANAYKESTHMDLVKQAMELIDSCDSEFCSRIRMFYLNSYEGTDESESLLFDDIFEEVCKGDLRDFPSDGYKGRLRNLAIYDCGTDHLKDIWISDSSRDGDCRYNYRCYKKMGSSEPYYAVKLSIKLYECDWPFGWKCSSQELVSVPLYLIQAGPYEIPGFEETRENVAGFGHFMSYGYDDAEVKRGWSGYQFAKIVDKIGDICAGGDCSNVYDFNVEIDWPWDEIDKLVKWIKGVKWKMEYNGDWAIGYKHLEDGISLWSADINSIPPMRIELRLTAGHGIHRYVVDPLLSGRLREYVRYRDPNYKVVCNDSCLYRIGDEDRNGYSFLFPSVLDLINYWLSRYYWWGYNEEYRKAEMVYGKVGYLGFVVHGIQDATIPHHSAGFMGYGHSEYEGFL